MCYVVYWLTSGPEDNFGFTEAIATPPITGQSGGVKLKFNYPVILEGGSILKISGTDAPAAFIVKLGGCMSFTLDLSQLLKRSHLRDQPLPRIQFIYVLKRQAEDLFSGPDLLDRQQHGEGYESHVWFRVDGDAYKDWRLFKSVFQPPVHGIPQVANPESTVVDQAARDVHRCHYSTITLERQRLYYTIFSSTTFDLTSVRKTTFEGLRVWTRSLPQFSLEAIPV